MILRGNHYRTGQRIDLTVKNERIQAIAPATHLPVDHVADWVAPGFFDIHINGCLGISYATRELTVEDVGRTVDEIRRHGVTRMLPTLVTSSFENLAHGFRTLVAAMEGDRVIRRHIAGFHLEGPYISELDGPRGAHPRDHIRPPNRDEFERLQESAAGRIRLVTLAPEYDEALDFVAYLAEKHNIVVALGHTAADGRRIRDAISAGATLGTHLGNACGPGVPRYQHAFWEQLSDDRLTVSLITDGHHLPATMVRSILRVKTSDRVIVISDASSLAGLPPGTYVEWGREIEVTGDGRVTIPGTNYLAGSGSCLDQCLAFATTECDVTLADAIDMMNRRPRQLMRMEANEIEVGEVANLVLFNQTTDGRIDIKAVIG